MQDCIGVSKLARMGPTVVAERFGIFVRLYFASVYAGDSESGTPGRCRAGSSIARGSGSPGPANHGGVCGASPR
jgi:hypothetical protein